MFKGGYGRNYNKYYDNNFIQMEKLEGFRQYLKRRGYTEYTPSGNKSTIYNYCFWIKRICEREKISLEELKINISFYIAKYDIGGQEEDFGTKRS